MMYSLDRPSARVIGEDDDDTIELQLSESAIRELTEAAALAQAASEERPDSRPAPGAQGLARPPRKSRLFALGIGMAAVVVGLFGGLGYLATARARHPLLVVADGRSRPTIGPEAPTSVPTSASALESAPAAAPAVTPDGPVRFRNPFDASEVFEFPAGMSRSDVRDAVAELLSQRALERQSLFAKRPRRNAKTVDGNASVTASRVTPRT